MHAYIYILYKDNSYNRRANIYAYNVTDVTILFKV